MGLLIFLLASSCTNSKDRIENVSVIQVNDRTLSTQNFSERLAQKLRHYDSLSAKDPSHLGRAKEEVLRQFVLESLIQDYAKANSIEISDQELTKEVNDFRSGYPDDVSFRQTLAEESLSFADWQNQLRLTLLERKVFAHFAEKRTKPNAEVIKNYYQENKEHFRKKERVYLRQILVDEKAKADEIRESLKSRDFASIATKFSLAPEGKNGGLVGWIEKGSLEVFDKAFQMTPGNISQVLESPYGFHILKVERKAPAGFATLEEVSSLIEKTLLAQKEQADFSAWLDKQIRASRVLRNNNLIKSISVETQKGNK